MLQVGLKIRAGNQNVVEVDEDEQQIGRSMQSLSIMRWKVFPALRSPKGMNSHSKAPKGVRTQVFGMSTSAIGTW